MTLAIDLEKLLRIAGPFDALFGPGVSHFSNLEKIVGNLGLVDYVLLVVAVFEPGRVDDARGCPVALDEIALRVVDAGDGVADGGANAVLLTACADCGLVECCEVPCVKLATVFDPPCRADTNMTNFWSEVLRITSGAHKPYFPSERLPVHVASLMAKMGLCVILLHPLSKLVDIAPWTSTPPEVAKEYQVSPTCKMAEHLLVNVDRHAAPHSQGSGKPGSRKGPEMPFEQLSARACSGGDADESGDESADATKRAKNGRR